MTQMTKKKEKKQLNKDEINSKEGRSETEFARQNSKAKSIILASAISMLPVLAVGTTTYYFGNQSLNEQIIQAQESETNNSLVAKLKQQKQLLEILSLGTGVTALLAGAIMALWANHTIRLAKTKGETANKQQNPKAQTNRTNLLTDVTKNIRASLQEEDILEATVEEVRKILNCDRVVVYSRQEKTRGLIVAESVDPRWPRALGKTIDDPCFDASYDEQYQNGRVRAIDDIYEAKLSRCYINQLENLEVKANLVIPVVNEGKLHSLLVAHQCSEPRAWQQWEIDILAQIAVQMGFAINNAQLLANSAKIQKQSESEAEWTNFYTDIIQLIRTSLKEKDVLKATVKEVRMVLQCDRVVVYSREEKTRGLVVAESVDPSWSRALGKTIDDPCFDASYDEQYQNGRVRAIDDIYEAKLSRCYINQLENLEVKANLVAPILNEGKLLGLLVAHQCSQPRVWQQIEIRWFAQIASQVGFAIDNARLLGKSINIEKQAETEAEWTQFYTNTIQYIRTSLQEENILEATVEEVQKVLQCDRVVIYSREEKTRGLVVAESVSPRWSRALGKTIDDPCFDASYDEQYQNGRVRAIDDIYEAKLSRCYINQLENLEVKANLVAPILNEGKLLGLLVAHQCSQPRVWQQFEIRWFAQIATQVGFAIDHSRLLRKVEQKSNVENVLEELGEKGDTIQLALTQMQEVVNSAREFVKIAQQVEAKGQDTCETLQARQELIARTADDLRDTLETTKQASEKLKNLTPCFEKLALTENLISDLTSRINEQTMNLFIQTGQNEEVDRESIVSLAEKVYSSTQELITATAQIKTLIVEIEAETNQVSTVVDTSSEKTFNSTKLFKETLQQFEQITQINNQTMALISQIARSATQQEKTSIVANQSLLELVTLTKQN